MTIMPVVAQTLKERFGLDARQHDPHLAVAKGAALYALMKKVKVSMPGRRRGPGQRPGGRRPARDQPGAGRELAAKRVATVVPRAFGLKVVDRPTRCTRPTRARARSLRHAPAHGQHAAARRHRPAGLLHRGGQPARGQAGGLGAGRLGRLGGAGAQHADRRGRAAELPPRPAGAPFEVEFHMTETGLLQVHGPGANPAGRSASRSRSAASTRRRYGRPPTPWPATR